MSQLPSGLETIDYGTQGWNAILTSNLQLLDQKLVSPMTAAKILGAATIANNATTVADPTAQSSAALTDNTTGTERTFVKRINGSGVDLDLNDNFATLTQQHNKVVNALSNIISVLINTIDYNDALKAKINELLVELRKSTGNGVLNG